MSQLFQAAEERRNQSRNASLVTVKAASGYVNPVMSAANSLGLAELGLGYNSGAAKHAEQYKYFRDWPFTAINIIGQRIAGQEAFVASVSDTAVMRATKNLDLMKRDRDQWHDFQVKLARAEMSLPDCFKAMGERLEPIDNHPMLEAIGQPNSIMVGYQLMYLLGCNLKITGEHIWWLDDFEIRTKKENGRFRIWPIPAHWATPIHTPDELFSQWRIRSPLMTEAIKIAGRDICYFYLPDPSDPLSSISPMQANARAIATDEQIQQSQYQLMKDGIRPDVILTAGRLPGMDGKEGVRPVLTDVQRQQLVEMIKLAHRGFAMRGEPGIIDGLIEAITPFSRTPQEMNFLESGQTTKERVFLGTGVNAISAGQTEGVNRASSASADMHLCANTINPMLTLISQVATVRVAPRFAKNGERLIFWVAPARAHDPELRIREWSTGKDATTPNEFRKHVLNLPPLKDEHADTPFYKIPKVGLPAPGADQSGTRQSVSNQSANDVNRDGSGRGPKPKPAGGRRGGAALGGMNGGRSRGRSNNRKPAVAKQ